MDRARSIREFFVDSLNGMALGLFSTLLIGLIMKQLGGVLGLTFLVDFGELAQLLMGPGIGVGVAYSLGAPALGIFASAVVGAIGGATIELGQGQALIHMGEPVGAYLAAVAGVFASRLADRDTSFKIVVIPLVTILVGGLTGSYLSPYISSLMKVLGSIINKMTELRPIPMGILISVFMGIILTLPISSAAIAISLGLSGLAAGASVVGCSCNMIGFAIISYRDNGLGGVFAQGLGTSMLQISNIVKKPVIWLPSIIASAILGPISTSLLKMTNNSVGAGMGTSGLVGQIGAFETMGLSLSTITKVVSLHFILPGLISYLVYDYMYRKKIIVDGDLKL